MQAENFLLYYKKDRIERGVLWEKHCHAHFELIAVLAGDVCVTLEGKEFPLETGNAILIPPLCYHSVTANKTGTYRRLTAAFEPDTLPPALCSLLFQGAPRPFCAGTAQVERLCSLCEQEKMLYAPLAGALMIELLYACADSAQAESDSVTDSILHRALGYIEKHLCEQLTLDDIAASVACSKSLLCHRFQARMRISPKQYILQKRMALAAKLIREGTPPTQAALRVGYDNYSNFYRMYQKHLQKAPSQ